MEIKIPGAMPVWLAELLSGMALFPTSFSKYGTCYRNYLSLASRRIPKREESSVLDSVLTYSATGSVTLTSLLICMACSLILGVGIAAAYRFHSSATPLLWRRWLCSP